MVTVNLRFAWMWVLAGLLAGAVQGLLFDREDWLGGYASWRRRLMRLGHVAFIGTGLLNFLFALTAPASAHSTTLGIAASILLLLGAVTMPLVCYLAAWRKPLRHAFFIPVASLVIGAAVSALLVFQEPS